MRRIALLAAVLVAGCGGDQEQAETTQSQPVGTTTEADPPPPPPPTAPSDTISVKVYFLRDGRIAAARRNLPATRAVARAAVEALAEGPNEHERAAGLTTSVPRRLEIERLSIDEGAARVDFAGEACPSTPQIVYTLTQFPTVKRVTGDCIPRRAYARGLTRADLEELTPPILVESPTIGEGVTSPLRISGTANTFEATFVVNVVTGEGDVLTEEVVTATSGSGDRGSFEVTVPFEVDRATSGALLAFERSAEDGSQLNLVEIPLRLAP